MSYIDQDPPSLAVILAVCLFGMLGGWLVGGCIYALARLLLS